MLNSMDTYITIFLIMTLYGTTSLIVLKLYNNYIKHKFLLKDRARPYAIMYKVMPIHTSNSIASNTNAIVTMINSRPSELIPKLKNQININWETETFHLIRCHTLT